MAGRRGQPDATILVVDDDPDVRLLVTESLDREGYVVIERSDGRAVMTALTRGRVDLVVLDLGLPGLHGLDLLSDIRRTSEVPVIILSGRGEESDRILGLKSGADDYLAKPFSPRELMARVETVLRRTRPARSGERLQFDGLSIDTETRDVLVNGNPVQMTTKEFDVLAHLAASPRRVFSRAQLLRDVWGSSPEWQRPTTVTEIVRRVRQKIEPDPANPTWIKTVRSVGYRFDVGPEAGL
jgi:DNA-binding response OmpR family regulator